MRNSLGPRLPMIEIECFSIIYLLLIMLNNNLKNNKCQFNTMPNLLTIEYTQKIPKRNKNVTVYCNQTIITFGKILSYQF